ncbi:antibiotic biosynthesis monooxygenase family protein [Leifsonia sp. NPDC058230]|uniref:antibiotic biosynthesis monooxygenase family protein n=1 Tax=Leifsonia sp. NPDC058230 TaxID=3346391 RepID=UPI0036DC9BEE
MFAHQAIDTPYYAVIITTESSGDDEGYAAMARRMAELGAAQPGYLGNASMSGGEGREVSIFYYRDEESIRSWYRHDEHREAQKLGRERWYSRYEIEVCRVERRYDFMADPHTAEETK